MSDAWFQEANRESGYKEFSVDEVKARASRRADKTKGVQSGLPTGNDLTSDSAMGLSTPAAMVRKNIQTIVNNRMLASVRDCFEHRQWPIHDDTLLRDYGDNALVLVAGHYSELSSLSKERFSLEEARRQFSKIKFDVRDAPFFTMGFRKFWQHISAHFADAVLGYPDLVILARVILLLVADTSCCEVGYSRVNRTQTKARVNMSVSTIENVLTTQFLGPKVEDFSPEGIFDMWTALPFVNHPDTARGRSLKAMMRKVVAVMSAR